MSTPPTGSDLSRLSKSFSEEEFQAQVGKLRELVEQATTEEEMRLLTSRIAQISRIYRVQNGIGLSATPALQAQEIDPDYVIRPHIEYLAERLTNAVRDVERGKSRKIAVSMPPRAGKSTLISQYTPLWLLRRHPEWKIVMASHDAALVSTWSRSVRRLIEHNLDLGVALAPDSRAWSKWTTVEGGGIYTTSVRGSLTGRGARVMIIDDPIKDFVDAHSPTMRQSLWDWWLSVAQTRLEPPSLVLVVMTRWHEDDFVGRLLSDEHEGDPREWEVIRLPAIAETDDVLGRKEGAPLLSPIVDETRSEAIERWDDVKRAVGSYTFSAMYQQRPAPAKGAIFDAGWWRYWTTDASKATEDGRVVHLDPTALTGARWLDSWDAAFKSSGPEGSGWVVGQRWVRHQANRYMISQRRGRWSFVSTIEEMKKWARTDDEHVSPFGHLVHERLIEERANGAAIIDTLKEQISGIKPVNPTISKEARARAVTPEIESGNVYLPLPSDPGNEWVMDLLSELRNFPHDVADDQVDALTQALSGLRDSGKGRITVPGAQGGRRPGQQGWQISRDLARSALTDLSRRRY